MILDVADGAQVTIQPARYGRMMTLSNDTYQGAAFAHYGEYSEAEVALWRQLLPPDALVADVGANLGAHTIALASLVPDGGVFAFEPLRQLYLFLCGNIALNGLVNVMPYHAAIGATRGSLLVPPIDYTRDAPYGGMELGALEEGNPVPVITLDELLPRIDFIKADVEGMEQQVLEGATRLITQCQPILYVENNQGPKQQALIDYIQARFAYDLWWHLAPHYNPDNVRANPENIYGDAVSVNMLGLPHHEGTTISGLPPIARRVT